MEENEAIKGLMFFKEKLYNGIFQDRLNCIDYAISAIKEIQQYRQIGTVEDITKIISFLSLSDDDLITKDFHELFEYRKIGTVKECREAREKQEAKNIIRVEEENMSDLISRKAAYEAFSNYLQRHYSGELSSQMELHIGEIASVIKSIPVAFDKKKVLDELSELTGEECTLHECGIRSEKCKACIAKKAVEIVDRSGLN